MAAPLTFHKPAIAQLLDMTSQLRAFERIPAAEHAALQGRQLAQLLRHAADFSPFWRERMQRAGLDPRQPTLATWQGLPILTRSELQDNFDALRARWPNMDAKRIQMAASSGSTGQPVRVEKDSSTYSLLYAAMSWAECQWHQRDPRLKMAVLAVSVEDSSLPHWGPVYDAMGMHGQCETRALQKGSLESHFDWLLQFRPDYLKCSPRVAAELAQVCLARGATLPLRHIMAQWERVTPWQRELCQRAFGAPIVDRYSCEEAGWLALQCASHQNLHVLNATVLLEIVDEANRPCKPGQVGRVVITPLFSHVMPLLRYEIGDLASWGEPCGCGMTLPVLGGLLGRTRHRVRLPDGSTIPMAFIGDELGRIPAVREFRVLQYRGGELELQIRAPAPLTLEEIAEVHAVLGRNGLGSLTVWLHQVAHIEWGTGRKREEFVTLDQPWPGPR